MKQEPAFLVITNRAMGRYGEAAKVIGVGSVSPDGLGYLSCYKVQYDDGVIGWVPVSESANFKIGRFSYIRSHITSWHVHDVGKCVLKFAFDNSNDMEKEKMIQKFEHSGRSVEVMVLFNVKHETKAGKPVAFHKAVASVDGSHFREAIVEEKGLIGAVQTLSDQAKQYIDQDVSDPLMQRLRDMGFERI